MLVASRWWLAVRAVMAAELRKWFTLFTLREDSRAPTSLRSPKRGGFLHNPHSLPREGIRGHRPRFARPPRIPTVCRRHPVQNSFIVFAQASLDSAVEKSFAERGGFEPPKPFWSLHAFQACLFNHSSISPSSECACRIDCRSAALGDRDSSS